MVLLTIFTKLIKLTISQKTKKITRQTTRSSDHVVKIADSDQAAANGSRLI